jgi:hypothetical protein
MAFSDLCDLSLIDRIRMCSQLPAAHSRCSAIPREVVANLELILGYECVGVDCGTNNSHGFEKLQKNPKVSKHAQTKIRKLVNQLNKSLTRNSSPKSVVAPVPASPVPGVNLKDQLPNLASSMQGILIFHGTSADVSHCALQFAVEGAKAAMPVGESAAGIKLGSWMLTLSIE